MTDYSLPLRIYIEDTDAGGIVYYANYLKFFERARTEFIRSKGVTLRASLEEGVSFVVNRVEMDYIQPSQLDDELLITVSVAELGASFILFEQSVVSHDGDVRVKGLIRVVCVGYPSLKPKRLSRELKAALLR